MYYALTLKDNVITGVHESLNHITVATFSQSPEFSGSEVTLVDGPSEYATGVDIRCYNEDGTLKPAVWCIEQGYMSMPPGHEIIDGQLVETYVTEAEAPPSLLNKVLSSEETATQAKEVAIAADGVLEELVALLIAQGVITSV